MYGSSSIQIKVPKREKTEISHTCIYTGLGLVNDYLWTILPCSKVPNLRR